MKKRLISKSRSNLPSKATVLSPRVKYTVSVFSIIIILLLSGCTHKILPQQYPAVSKVDTMALGKLSKIKESFVSENYYYISSIDSLPNDVFVIFAVKDGKTYKILSHGGKDYERLWDDFSNNKIEVGSSYPLYLESWKEKRSRPKDLYEYCDVANSVEYYGNSIRVNDSDLDLYFANYLNGLYLPKGR